MCETIGSRSKDREVWDTPKIDLFRAIQHVAYKQRYP